MAADTQILKGETQTDPKSEALDVQGILEKLLDALIAEVSS